ncbi:hypothetical protein GN244_ATG09490 [Phytophthora infestans]|uniref:Transmembrane protein n=1 Tax=Phytophthora infestans TaxID=4787 RepID=A0A833WDM3_PHYIN|nr:hypothetical protein GN244_ATG09490 [Phytophthora infestans]
MKPLPLFVAVVLAQRCAGQNGVREVVIGHADARVIQVRDHLHGQEPQYGTQWGKIQSEQQASKNPIDADLGAKSFTTESWPRRWMKLLDGTWLHEFWVQCERDPVFKAGTTHNLSAMQAFVAFVSIGILVTYTAAGLVQSVFLAHAFSFMDIYYAYPLTLVLVIVFFVAFNLTNALLVLEYEDSESLAEAQVQHIIEASATRVVTAQRAACF